MISIMTNMTAISEPNPDCVTTKSIVSILKPQSLSLEPKDIRSRTQSNTPRKVQFTVVEGKHGGRGRTEFQKTPQRKSHTKRQLPLGIFDTDSNTDTDAEHSQHNLSDIEEDAAPSILDHFNSKKFMANSRLVRLVQKKKKLKEKEQRWLTMISPDVGLYSQHKTKSKLQHKNTLQRFKSPSHSMSRGRRALFHAQKQMNKKSANGAAQTTANTLVVKGTPMVKKVSAIAMRMRNKEIDHGNDADEEDGDDDLPINHGNNGSIPLELIQNEVPSELTASNGVIETEMKDNSYHNSPSRPLADEESDELKVEDANPSIFVPFDANDEDDDLLSNAFCPKLKQDVICDEKNENDVAPIPNKPHQLNFNLTSPSSRRQVPESPKMVPHKMQSVFTRSIGTQTQYMECEIGIQAVEGVGALRCDNMNSLAMTPFVIMKNKPMVIATAFGAKFIRITQENEPREPQQQQIDSVFHEHPMVGPYFCTVDDTNVEHWHCANAKCTKYGQNGRHDVSYWRSSKLGKAFCLCHVCVFKKEKAAEEATNNHNIEELETLSLNIEKTVEQNKENMDRVNVKNKVNMRGKRKFEEAMQPDDELQEEQLNQSKRRRVDHTLTKVKKQKKFQKKDIIWTSYNGNNEPGIILNCEYNANERFFPSKYELIWLNWTDTTDENGREGECSITTEEAETVQAEITMQELDGLFKKQAISVLGWKEVKRLRPDIYTKYFDVRDRRRSTKVRKVRRRRRASVM